MNVQNIANKALLGALTGFATILIACTPAKANNSLTGVKPEQLPYAREIGQVATVALVLGFVKGTIEKLNK